MRKAKRYLFTARRTAGALLLGPATVSGRARLDVLSRALGWEVERGRWPVREIGQIVQTLRPVPMYLPHERSHNMRGFELACLCQLVAWRRPTRLFEFGTYDGRTAANLLLNAPPDAHLFTINIPPERFGHQGVAIGECLPQAGLQGRFTQLLGDTTTYDFAAHRGQMDFTFIDAGHSYECVMSDSTNALAMLAPGGLIAWHDYGQIGEVTAAVDAFVRRERLENRVVRIADTSIALLLPESAASR